MLFLVISTPRPDSPSVMKDRRKLCWDWIEPLKASGELTAFHARVGRGGIAIFNVASNLALHRRMSEWAEMIPTTFEVYPLVDDADATQYLDQHRPADAATAPRGKAARKALKTGKAVKGERKKGAGK